MSDHPVSKSEYRRLAAQGGDLYALEVALAEIKTLKADNARLREALESIQEDAESYPYAGGAVARSILVSIKVTADRALSGGKK